MDAIETSDIEIPEHDYLLLGLDEDIPIAGPFGDALAVLELSAKSVNDAASESEDGIVHAQVMVHAETERATMSISTFTEDENGEVDMNVLSYFMIPIPPVDAEHRDDLVRLSSLGRMEHELTFGENPITLPDEWLN